MSQKLECDIKLWHIYQRVDTEVDHVEVDWLGEPGLANPVTPFMRLGHRAGPIATKWNLSEIYEKYISGKEFAKNHVIEQVKEIFAKLEEHDIMTTTEPYTSLEIWVRESEFRIKFRRTYRNSLMPVMKPRDAEKEVLEAIRASSQQTAPSKEDKKLWKKEWNAVMAGALIETFPTKSNHNTSSDFELTNT